MGNGEFRYCGAGPKVESLKVEAEGFAPFVMPLEPGKDYVGLILRMKPFNAFQAKPAVEPSSLE